MRSPRAGLFGCAVVVAFCCTQMSGRAEAASDAVDSKERSRLEELFIWKASEELKLPPKEETKFNEIIHELNARRRAAGEELEVATKQLDEVKSKAEIEKALARHKAALKRIQALQLAELDQLKQLLGPEKLARYLVVKTSLLEKLKTLISSPAPTPTPSK